MDDFDEFNLNKEYLDFFGKLLTEVFQKEETYKEGTAERNLLYKLRREIAATHRSMCEINIKNHKQTEL